MRRTPPSRKACHLSLRERAPFCLRCRHFPSQGRQIAGKASGMKKRYTAEFTVSEKQKFTPQRFYGLCGVICFISQWTWRACPHTPPSTCGCHLPFQWRLIMPLLKGEVDATNGSRRRGAVGARLRKMAGCRFLLPEVTHAIANCALCLPN